MALHPAGRRPHLRLVGWSAVLLAAAASASAQTPAGAPQAPSRQAAAKPVAAPPAARAQGLTIARDADTGALRAPTEAEAAALAAPAPTTPSDVIQFITPSGSIAAQVPEEFLTFTVVSKSGDGSLTSVCLPDKQAAESAVRRAAAQPVQSAARSRTPLRPAPGAPNE